MNKFKLDLDDPVTKWIAFILFLLFLGLFGNNSSEEKRSKTHITVPSISAEKRKEIRACMEKKKDEKSSMYWKDEDVYSQSKAGYPPYTLHKDCYP